jgi:hypothetical protein
MQTTSHTARLAALITAAKSSAASGAAYTNGQLEGGEGYNPHDMTQEQICAEIATVSTLDRDERAANLSADETAAMRLWINSQGFKSASQADNALRDTKGITLDGFKAAMARNNIA